MTARQVFFPTASRQSRSRVDGNPYITIWFDEVNVQRECLTHIFSSCRNQKYWDNIIANLDKDMFIEFENLVWKDEKRGLIDADSIPTIVLLAEKGQIQATLREHKQAQDKQKNKKTKKVKPQGQFGNLFDIEDEE